MASRSNIKHGGSGAYIKRQRAAARRQQRWRQAPVALYTRSGLNFARSSGAKRDNSNQMTEGAWRVVAAEKQWRAVAAASDVADDGGVVNDAGGRGGSCARDNIARFGGGICRHRRNVSAAIEALCQRRWRNGKSGGSLGSVMKEERRSLAKTAPFQMRPSRARITAQFSCTRQHRLTPHLPNHRHTFIFS